MTDSAMLSSWPLAERTDLRDTLVSAYDGPGRGYHDLTHLAEMFAALDEIASRGERFDRKIVLLAAWFHDAVYGSGGSPSDEERSARLAEQALAECGRETAHRVAALVRMTETHRPIDDDGRALCDADLAILAAPRDRYDGYVAGVRREYADYDDATFAAGRAAILRDLVDRPHLFNTAAGRELWEAKARANLTEELATLEQA